ncbi:FG-GAP repeat domain-containing protein [Lutimaribacter marinistellae]|uniref:FG-GAP repeat domain-containing protein n=1 Tax=Lutimaribacter marinistellae TaxID=1820329 RepID=A0ABV7THY8_9RHOB
MWHPLPALADAINAARYTQPTTRYAHGVLGDAIEWGALEMTLASGRTISVTLPENRVFEDLAPRLADLDGDGAPEVIVVEAEASTGASLAIYGPRGKITATPHIGQRNRWLAPAGIGDLDGDGYVELAYVDRPHLARTLRIWRYDTGRLTEIAQRPGVTNHRIGEDFITGGLRDCGQGPELVLASADWSRLLAVFHSEGWQTRDLGPFSGRTAVERALDCQSP